jgi:hypothetical protein
MRRRLFNGIACGDALTSLLSTAQGERRRRSEPIGQDREGLAAGMADSAPHPNAIMAFVVGLAKPLSMADDRVLAANRTSSRQ